MMKHDDPQFKIRIPLELKAHIEAAAEAAKRTVSAEILKRLDESFTQPRKLPELPLVVSAAVRQLVQKLGCDEEEALLRLVAAGELPSAPLIVFLRVSPDTKLEELRATLNGIADLVPEGAGMIVDSSVPVASRPRSEATRPAGGTITRISLARPSTTPVAPVPAHDKGSKPAPIVKRTKPSTKK